MSDLQEKVEQAIKEAVIYVEGQSDGMVFHGMTTKQERKAYAEAAIDTIFAALLSDEVFLSMYHIFYGPKKQEILIASVLDEAVKRLKEETCQQ